MGNGVAKLTPCFSGAGEGRRRHLSSAAVTSEPFPDDGFGHSFFYSSALPTSTSATASGVGAGNESEIMASPFFSISGAAISANPSTPLSTSALLHELTASPAASFESSRSFASIPLHPAPRLSASLSGPLSADHSFSGHFSERQFMSGPLDRPALFSGPLDRPSSSSSSLSSGRLQRNLSQIIAERRAARRRHRANRSFFRFFSKAASKLQLKKPKRSADDYSTDKKEHEQSSTYANGEEIYLPEAANGGNVQWAQGKAGEDRVHVVVSEEHGWVFVGIYDGFNGPDATDFLLSNLYSAVHQELKGLLWEEEEEEEEDLTCTSHEQDTHVCSSFCCEEERKNLAYGDMSELDRIFKEQLQRANSATGVQHPKVLKALSQALKKTEDSYLDIADKMVLENPELALMGSCLLVMLMKGEDIYIMNVGDSRAVLAQKSEPDLTNILGKATQDLEKFKVEMMRQLEAYEMDELSGLTALQLTSDHSTSVDDEVRRIRSEHPDDPSAVVNGRVKGSLKVTRAFGAGYLKQPKWNNALLERFRIDYVGASPYITCNPNLRHHKLTPKDRFLILSSDGLYQYFTNEEVVAEVELFITTNPEGDPAQYLVEGVLRSAARAAGMDFHELLDIPQGFRRKYHDDVSIIIISLEGRIWRSSM
ncbi:probable protein phosphatase 2C 4 [Typha angustifolia]|uniref:probable protein phosphatase 2C 4 n=1 Tax=Typha angustifolia TaxID=59011 RepID=UPI003C2D86D5